MTIPASYADEPEAELRRVVALLIAFDIACDAVRAIGMEPRTSQAVGVFGGRLATITRLYRERDSSGGGGGGH